MITTDHSKQSNEQPSEIPMQRQWPQLGREVFAVENALTDPGVASDKPHMQQQTQERIERFRNRILAQLYQVEGNYSRAARYCASLVVKNGRGGEIVGNPYYVDEQGRIQELPYTGLEGYYAGSQRTSDHPGLTVEEIVQEEANQGVILLRTLKKQAVKSYSWARFAKMKKALEGGELDVEDLENIRDLWTGVVRRLRVRVYNNEEFEATITEQIEQLEKLLGSAPTRTEEEKEDKSLFQAEYERMKRVRDSMSQEEREQEQKERRTRENIRRERLSEYNHFREETYELLKEVEENGYDVCIQDGNWQEATIIEKISLPTTRQRNEYPSVEVKLTPAQVEGYLFLAELGEVGGDPLTSSMLISPAAVLLRKEASK